MEDFEFLQMFPSLLPIPGPKHAHHLFLVHFVFRSIFHPSLPPLGITRITVGALALSTDTQSEHLHVVVPHHIGD